VKTQLCPVCGNWTTAGIPCDYCGEVYVFRTPLVPVAAPTHGEFIARDWGDQRRKLKSKMKITLKDQDHAGVFPEHAALKFSGGGIATTTRMTIPAREALERVSTIHNGAYFYTVPPAGIVAVLAPMLEAGAPTGAYMTALRCTDEPPIPGELPNEDMWIMADLTPCPKCGAALVWYEAGYVPGYRVCAGADHHHYIVCSTKDYMAATLSDEQDGTAEVAAREVQA